MHDDIVKVCDREDLTADEVAGLFTPLMRGELDDVSLTALLVGLKAKGETPEEIAGAARALIDDAASFPSPDLRFADSCGTGGDGAGTVNVSTAVAFTAAAAGLPIAKHGNRSVSSRCGSADVLESLGVRLEASPDTMRRALDAAGVCFLFAPNYHAGVRHAMPVRRALSMRTLLNLLGPLVNPARPQVQLIGVYDPALVETVARTCGLLGVEDALVVHGAGLDEIALHGPTDAALLRDGEVTRLTLRPEDAGVKPAPLDALAGGDPQQNAAWLERALAGDAPRAHLDAIALNAGALLWTARRVDTLQDGVIGALETLATGAPLARLRALAEISRDD